MHNLNPHLQTVVVALALAGALIGARADASLWHDDFASARAAAGESGKPLLVEFHGPGCGPCEQMERETLSDAEVSAMIREHFEPLRVNAVRDSDVATRYLVATFPTVKFIDADGTAVYDHASFVPPDRFMEVMREALQAHGALRRARALAEDAGDGYSAHTALRTAVNFLAARQHDVAAQWSRRALERAGDEATELRAHASYVLGVALLEIGEPREAADHLETALLLDPGAVWAWEARLKLGFAWLQFDRRDRGADLLRVVADANAAEADTREEARRLLRWAGLEAH